MDSASSGSFKYRYNSEVSPSRLALPCSSNFTHNPEQRVVELVHHPLLQRNDGVIRNMDIFRTNLCATFRYVAQSDAQLILQQLRSGNAVHRMHFQSRHAHKKSWPAKLLVLIVISQHMANILAKKTLNALAKFLNP